MMVVRGDRGWNNGMMVLLLLWLWCELLGVGVCVFGLAVAGTSSSSMGGGSVEQRPIVWSIAGSDSGGGAGIQADLHAMQNMGAHGCTVLTCLTAQNSQGVSYSEPVSKEMIEAQMEALWKDLPPRALKIGALLSTPVVTTVGQTLQRLLSTTSSSNTHTTKPWIVLDPVMISTSGHLLLEDDAILAMRNHIFPHVDILTPNRFEAQALLNGRSITSPEAIEQAAADIIHHYGVKAVLIKGGHADEDQTFAQDYFLSSTHHHDGPSSNPHTNEYRLCDATRGVWIRTKRYDTNNTHGTGCTLSSAIASSLAISHLQNDNDTSSQIVGAKKSILPVDAICLAKAYVTAGIAQSIQLGQGPGPVAHTSFPNSHEYFPTISTFPKSKECLSYLPMKRYSSSSNDHDKDEIVLGTILPIVDSVEWIQRLCQANNNGARKIQDVQLRIKGVTDEQQIKDMVKEAQSHCQNAGIRLWINDFWEAAMEAKVFGVHLGQEDLAKCVDSGACETLRAAGMALGISTHSYAELSTALALRPSYISLGPIYGTQSKNVAFAPQGLSTLSHWRNLIGPDIPLVSIGGISNAALAKENKAAGADCVAVIGAITQSDDISQAIDDLYAAME